MQTSIFTAELYAILQALYFIQKDRSTKYVIFTDSLSSLQALNIFNQDNRLVRRIIKVVKSLHDIGRILMFCWIPSHVGLAGNEAADITAKHAISNGRVVHLRLPPRDIYPTILSSIHSEWQRSWNSKCSKLKVLKPTLGKWLSSHRTKRREEVILCRLRIGHTFATHSYMLTGNDRPVCPRCSNPLTVYHVLVGCTLLEPLRRQILGRLNTDSSLRMLIGNDSEAVASVNIFMFIRQARLHVIYPHP